jgi:quercetin dioxygenase-like cupin family protein
MMEITNIYTAKGEPLPGGGGEHKTILTSGDRLRCLYYKVLFNPEKDVMDGAHPHPVEIVFFVIDGEIELNINGESVILKKGDATLLPVDTVMGTKTLSSTPAEILAVTTIPNASHESHKAEK